MDAILKCLLRMSSLSMVRDSQYTIRLQQVD